MTNPIGTWKLVHVEAVNADGDVVAAPFGGDNAMGLLTLTEQGRMMAVLCDGSPDMPDSGTREYNSYCGTYRYDGRQLVTTVDACARPEYHGTQQVRDVSFEGELMVLRPPLRPYGNRVEQRTLRWQRV